MELYHVLNRGVDKRTVFMDKQDYLRFERNLFLLNNKNDVPTNDWTIRLRMEKDDRKRIVNIHGYCLMPNHYHLLLSPVVENGISLFMKKINMGYSRYFNERNERSGSLWQGKYKSISIEKDAHFIYMPFYVHLNALDITLPEWRHGTVTNFKKAITDLNTYRWSSHNLYLNPERITGSIIENSIFAKLYSSQAKYLNEIKKIISSQELSEASALLE